MNPTEFQNIQRLDLKGMTTEALINLIRIAAENYPDMKLTVTPRIDQRGNPYYWTGLRYGQCTELDFKLLLNRETEAFILSFLIRSNAGLLDISDCTPDPSMTQGINWLQYHQYRHLEYAQTVKDYIRTSNGRTFQNRKLTFPYGSIIYSTEIQDVFSASKRL